MHFPCPERRGWGGCRAISESRFQFRFLLHGRRKKSRAPGLKRGRERPHGITGIVWTRLETRAKIPNPDVSALCIDRSSSPFLHSPVPFRKDGTSSSRVSVRDACPSRSSAEPRGIFGWRIETGKRYSNGTEFKGIATGIVVRLVLSLTISRQILIPCHTISSQTYIASIHYN